MSFYHRAHNYTGTDTDIIRLSHKWSRHLYSKLSW